MTISSAKEALLPCPFCGGDNVKVSGPYGWYRQWCITHSCRTFYSGAQEIAQGFPSEAEARAAWNTRETTSEALKTAAGRMEWMAKSIGAPRDELWFKWAEEARSAENIDDPAERLAELSVARQQAERALSNLREGQGGEQ